MRNFIDEAHMEPGPQAAPMFVDELLTVRRLFLWRDPEPIAMAAWITSAEKHHCINIVYVPPANRGKGAARCVTSALASLILSSDPGSGCFILTDTQDDLTNHLYRSIGGLGVAELLRCSLNDSAPETLSDINVAGRLNVTSSRFCAT
jgi:predicted GNAT family acetyltransferase